MAKDVLDLGSFVAEVSFLQEQVITLLKRNQQILFVFQKIPTSTTAVKRACGLIDEKDRKSGICYDAQGNIIQDTLNLLNERPNY